jgi:uncharacterized protein DUF4349
MKTLEDMLEEITPTPDPDFVADMEWRMRRGFPPKRKPRLPRISFSRLGPRPRMAAAVAASALLALMVVVAVTGGGEDRSEQALVEPFTAEPAPRADDMGGGGAATGEGLRRRALKAPTAVVQDEMTSASGGGSGVAPGARVRRIERSAAITLASDPADFDDLSDEIFRTADRRDGFVLQSSFTQGEEGLSNGFFELRVPSGQLQQTLNDLSGLATVRARSESGTDVTAPFVSVRDRLRTARALRTSLLNRLEVAFTDTAVAALRQRLEIVGNRIDRLREQLRGMRERTEFATVTVELVDEDTGAASGETDEAVDDAIGSLQDIFNFLIRAVGILLPIGLAVGIGWLVATRARKRARDRALA